MPISGEPAFAVGATRIEPVVLSRKIRSAPRTKMMETAGVEGRPAAAAQTLLTGVPVQIVVTESPRDEAGNSKMTAVTTSNGVHHQELMTAAQYMHLHRIPPDQLNKVLVQEGLSGELIAHHVELAASAADFAQHTVTARYCEAEDILTHDLTEDDRRLAAELVAAQLKHQHQHQQQTAVLSQELLNSKTITPLSAVQLDKPTISVVTSYIQAVEDEAVQHQLLEQHGSQERCVMKIYPQQSAPSELQYNTIQVLSRAQSQPLPPLKKVLSSQSMMVRNRYAASPTIMVELPNAQIMEASGVPVEECMKAEALEEAGRRDDLDSDYDAESDTRPSRRSLPHKKRIPRKLKASPVRGVHVKSYKCSKCGESFASQAALSSHKIVHSAPAGKRPPGANAAAAAGAFNCELCSKAFANQLKFFEHLKQHYEPGAAVMNGASTTVNVTVAGNNVMSTTTAPGQPQLPELTPAPNVTSTIMTASLQQQHHQQQLKTAALENALAVKANMLSQGRNNVIKGDIAPPEPTESGAMMAPTLQQQIMTSALENALTVKAELINQNVVKEEVVSSTGGSGGGGGGGSGLSCGRCGKAFRRAKALGTHMSVAHPRQEEIEEFGEPEDMMEGIRHVVNIPTVDSGDEEHGDEKLRWRYQVTGTDYSSMQDLGMELQDMCRPMEPAENMPPTDEGGGGGAGEPGDPQAEKGGKGSANGRKRQLACLQCDRVFNHRNSLLYHIRSHSGQRPHQCEVCGKRFFSASALKVHMRLHSGDKPYKCEYCGRNFRQWGDLKYHVTSLHSDQKQFQCEYCGKDFARKYSLIVHRRIHTGEKNYRCEFCQKTFRASSYLQNHRRIHTGEKPHACDVCGKPFRVRSDMKRHQHTHNRERPSSRSNSGAAALTASDQEDNTETILPDSVPTPLNLNIRQADAHEELAYTTAAARNAHAIEREGNTLYVWIPAQPESILSNE